MAQHFLLSAEARTLSLRQIFGLADDTAFPLFREARCGKDADPACPHCGVSDRHYFHTGRRQWRC